MYRNTPTSRFAALLGLTVLLLGAGACGRDDEASIEERLDEKGTMDLVEEIAQDEYDPPADGELSEEQMEMYLAVQERAVKIRQVAQKRMEERTGEGEETEGEDKKPGLFEALRAVGDLGDLVTADLRAAKELGYNAAEYQWVRGQVVAAQVARMGREMQAGFGEARQQALDSLKAQRDAAPDDETRRLLEQQIEEVEQGFADAEADMEEEPGVAHNVELVERYQERLQRVEKAASEQS
jgi:hypothetical protein